jgi:hypothetical protein
MSQVVPPPIIRSAYNYLQHLAFVTPEWYHHPSSGAHTNVSTASGFCHTGVAHPPIIRSAYNCIYNIWLFSHRGGTTTHHQERIQLYLQQLAFVTPLLLPATIVEELELQETALHVSGGNSTHHQEPIQLYLQHLAFVIPLLLPAPIVEELELLEFQLFHNSGR